MKLKIENKEYIIISITRKPMILDIEFGKVNHAFREDEVRIMEDVLSGVALDTAFSISGIDGKGFEDYVVDYMRETCKSIYICKVNNKTVYSYIDNYTDDKLCATENFSDLVRIAQKEVLGANTL